ncbi:GPCR family 2 secretin-like, partial [Trinorchestia longiramus]
VLITKLRSANTVETQRYRKATKAMLVLNPLLGLNYVLLIALPQELEHLHPCLLSTQGLWVALFYCFLNSEVQNSIRHHIARWRTERGLLSNSRSLEKLGRDVSPRGRSRLSSYSRRFFAGMGNKRESVCSEVTTTTTFITNGSNQPHHNFHHQKTSKQLLPLHNFPTTSNSGPGALQPRHFRHSQPNLSQVSYFNTTRNPAEVSDLNAVTDSNVENLLPTYRPVSRNSTRT